MRTRDEHLRQAKTNERFAELLIHNNEFPEWAVTALFYAAAHYGRAYIVQRGARTITNHPGFESYFHRYWKPPPEIFSHYRRLKDESERARYDCVQYTKAEVIDLRDKQFVPFREAVLKALVK